MEKFIFTIILTTVILCAKAQTSDNNVSIGIICPESYEHFSGSGITRLSQKLTQIATQNGVATLYDGSFVMYPMLSVYDIQIVEGGMRNITTLKIDMTVNVMQMGLRTIIGSLQVALSGSGFSVTEATTNAISKINPKDKEYASFLTECKERILEYDEQNYPNLILKAKALASQRQYEAALTLLANYPENLPSHPKVSEVAISIFKEYQKSRSAQLILEAKSAISIRDYESAAKLLSEIDPESPSYKECLTLIETIKNNVSKERREEMEREQKLYSSQVELEKHRISAIKEVAKAYYSNQPTITYTQIVK